MDSRSAPDAVQVGFSRFRQNVMVADQGKACRRPGWAKYRTERPIYNNEDLHDQLLGLQTYYGDRQVPYSPQSDITIYPPGRDATGQAYCLRGQALRTTGRQPVTFLFQAIGTTGVRKLLAGTQNRIYALDEGKGNYQIISDAYGGEPGTGLHRRWHAAQVNDVIVFTNNYDPPLSYTLDSAIQGCAMQGVQAIDTLTGIGLTKAGVVASWKGTIFLGDVEMDGDRVEYRVVWSRFSLPLNFTPGVVGGNGTAGDQDLAYGGRILAMVPLLDVLLIYTTTSIWQVDFVGGPQVFQFTERYSETSNGEGCLAYRNTIVSTGNEHIYCGRDGVYTYDLFKPKPERTEWIHKATDQVFSTLDEAACDAHVGYWYPAMKEYWLSWVEVGHPLPRRSLVFNLQYQTDDFVDHGFTAFCNHAPDDRGTLLDFLVSRGLCTPSELDANAALLTSSVKEGGYCDPSGAPINPAGIPDRDIPIWTNNFILVDGRPVEDYTKPTPDASSLCGLLGDLTLEDLCEECPAAGLLLMASAVDGCIKQYSFNSGVYYRERSTAFEVPCGTWLKDGYDSIIRTGAQDYGFPREDKDCRALELEYLSDTLQVVPSALEMRIAYSAQAVDSNNDNSGRCAILWRPLKLKTLECLADFDGNTEIAKGLRPNRTMNWNFLYTGRFFYFELRIAGINGGICVSRLTSDVRQRLRSIAS